MLSDFLDARTSRDLAIIIGLGAVMGSAYGVLEGDLGLAPVVGYYVLLGGFSIVAYWRGRTLGTGR